eukprot:343586-Prymnesium_polylepis.2
MVQNKRDEMQTVRRSVGRKPARNAKTATRLSATTPCKSAMDGSMATTNVNDWFNVLPRLALRFRIHPFAARAVRSSAMPTRAARVPLPGPVASRAACRPGQ